MIVLSEKDLIFILVIIAPMILLVLWHLAEYLVLNAREIGHKLYIICILLLTPVVIFASLIAYGFKGAKIKRRIKEFWA